MTISKGVIYVATGEKYFQEALKASENLKSVHPDLPVTVFSDVQKENNFKTIDQIGIIDDPVYHWGDKIKGILKSPYDYTLYLDTDTYVCEDISEIFELMDKVSLAVAHDPNRFTSKDNYKGRDKYGVPNVFPEFQCGVMAFNKLKSDQFIKEWFNNHEKMNRTNDQFSFKVTLYNSDVRYATLPVEYNFKISGPLSYGQPVKIIHSKKNNAYLYRLSKNINKYKFKKSLYVPSLGVVSNFAKLRFIQTFKKLLNG